MATIRHHPDGRLTIGMSIADPLLVVAVPLGCWPLATAGMTLLLLAGLAKGQISLAAALPGIAVLLPLFALGAAVFLCLFRQTWEFNPSQRSIKVKRGPLVVRRESLDGLYGVRLIERDDSDGDTSAQAVLTYANGSEIPANRVYSASVHELRAFVQAANAFLARSQPAPSPYNDARRGDG